MNFNIEKGNLFDLPKSEYIFAHCIAADLKWGAGIAPVLIKKEYNSENACRYNSDGGNVKEQLTVGNIFPVFSENGIFVNLITKDKTWNKPTYQTLRSSLVALKVFMICNQFNKLAMPKIGCGLDGLDWDKVENIIKEIFNDTDIDIEVRYL